MDEKTFEIKFDMVNPECSSAGFVIKSEDDLKEYIQNMVNEAINNSVSYVINNKLQLDHNKKAASFIKENPENFEVPYIKQNFKHYELTNNLKEILKSRGISLEKLAELIQVSRNTMTSIVNNKGTSGINMFKISKVLGLPMDEIFKYEEIKMVQRSIMDEDIIKE